MCKLFVFRQIIWNYNYFSYDYDYYYKLLESVCKQIIIKREIVIWNHKILYKILVWGILDII